MGFFLPLLAHLVLSCPASFSFTLGHYSGAWLYLCLLVLACGRSLLPVHFQGASGSPDLGFGHLFACMLMHAFATLVSFAATTVLLCLYLVLLLLFQFGFLPIVNKLSIVPPSASCCLLWFTQWFTVGIMLPPVLHIYSSLILRTLVLVSGYSTFGILSYCGLFNVSPLVLLPSVLHIPPYIAYSWMLLHHRHLVVYCGLKHCFTVGIMLPSVLHTPCIAYSYMLLHHRHLVVYCGLKHCLTIGIMLPSVIHLYAPPNVFHFFQGVSAGPVLNQVPADSGPVRTCPCTCCGLFILWLAPAVGARFPHVVAPPDDIAPAAGALRNTSFLCIPLWFLILCGCSTLAINCSTVGILSLVVQFKDHRW